MTKNVFLKACTYLETFSRAYPFGLNLNSLGDTVSNPVVFKQYFEDNLTRMAIQYNLFNTSPLTKFMFDFGTMLITVHNANEYQTEMSGACNENTYTGKFADL
jgi:hypothetical protein